MNIIGSDLVLFRTTAAGVLPQPIAADGANSEQSLEATQRAAFIGEAIPIVFCRRVNNVGGVLIHPPATEVRYDAPGGLTDLRAQTLLVLGEGPMDTPQARDVFQRSCTAGTAIFAPLGRASTFVPGNFLVNSMPELTSYCGTGGSYENLATLAHTFDWFRSGYELARKQIHVFIRGGLHVTRLLDSTTGPSNNVADLVKYLLLSSSRVQSELLDSTSLLKAATFTNVNGFLFNGAITQSQNLRDWMASVLPYFLLASTRIGGKEGLRTLIPTNANGTIQTTRVYSSFTFTEEHVVPDTFQVFYSSLADRKPFIVSVLWRQQDDLGIPVTRLTHVKYDGTTLDGPYEQHDLSAFCTTENHAVKVGAYILSKRRHVLHRAQVQVHPDAFNSTLTVGSLVRVRLECVPSSGAAFLHDYLYEVDRISKNLVGEIVLELTHFPVNADFQSVVALEVNDAAGSGTIVPTGVSALNCAYSSGGVGGDTSGAGDSPVTVTTGTGTDLGDLGGGLGDFGGGGIDGFGGGGAGGGAGAGAGGGGGGGAGGDGGFGGGGAGGTGGIGGFGGGGDGLPASDFGGLGGAGGSGAASGNPTDPPTPLPGITGNPGSAGSTLTYDLGCANQHTTWQLCSPDGACETISSASGNTYNVTARVAAAVAQGFTVTGTGTCPGGNPRTQTAGGSSSIFPWPDSPLPLFRYKFGIEITTRLSEHYSCFLEQIGQPVITPAKTYTSYNILQTDPVANFYITTQWVSLENRCYPGVVPIGETREAQDNTSKVNIFEVYGYVNGQTTLLFKAERRQGVFIYGTNSDGTYFKEGFDRDEQQYVSRIDYFDNDNNIWATYNPAPPPNYW